MSVETSEGGDSTSSMPSADNGERPFTFCGSWQVLLLGNVMVLCARSVSSRLLLKRTFLGLSVTGVSAVDESSLHSP